MSMANLERRALEYYVISFGALEQPGNPATWPAVFWAWTATDDGNTYVVVGIDPVASTPGHEVLAVYQVTTTAMRRRPKLQRLKRWPKAIEDLPTEDQVQRWDRRYRERLAWWE
jgi:hypothetical protein